MRKLFDAFMVALGVFLLGSLAGALLVVFSPDVRRFVANLFQVRMLGPIQAASGYGKVAMVLLIFANNSIPALLSYIYPFLIGKVRWTPALTKKRQSVFLTLFTVIVAFLLGFFGLGAGLAIGSFIGGTREVLSLLATAWVHAPLEFGFILLCVAEPLRLTAASDDLEIVLQLKGDMKLLLASLTGLLISSIIEVFALV